MWHEARKQEKKIRGMMVDYRKRAERRREFYEKTKADPTQFLQLHGRQCKIHLDPAVAQAADSPANMMPWQGQADTLIDRFDGRAHLDYIVEYKDKSEVENPSEETEEEERQANYERYRILVENDFIGLSEEKFLMQIYLEEQYGPIGHRDDEKKKSCDKKAAIGYTYEDSTPGASSGVQGSPKEEEKDSDSDIDLDVTVDIDALNNEQALEMNEQSVKYGMVGDDFMSLMTRDKMEAESLRLAKEAEEEKAMYSGRKSRRERRAFREKKLQGRKISPPSYAARKSPTYNPYRRSKSTSRSRSKSPLEAGKITYITSFGGDASDESGSERNKWRSTFVGAGVVTASESSMALLSKENPHKHDKKLPVVSSSSSRRQERSRHHGNNGASSGRNRSRSRSRSRSRNRRVRHGSYRHHGYHRSRSRSRSPPPLPPSRVRSRPSHRRSVSSSSSGSSARKQRRSPRSSTSSSSPSSSSATSSTTKSPSSSLLRSRASRSRSRSPSHNRNRRSSPRRQRSHSKSPSRSPAPVSAPPSSAGNTAATPTGGTTFGTTAGSIPRYYGRRREHDHNSSSYTGDSSGDDHDNGVQSSSLSTTSKSLSMAGKAVIGIKGQSKLTPQERLKRRMQAALNRQYKADKRAEQRKIEKQEQERQDREEELRELAIRLRRREREKRHRRQDSDRERSPRRKHRARSRSRSWSKSHSSSGSSTSSTTSTSSKSRSKSPPQQRSHSSSSSGSSRSPPRAPRGSSRGLKRRTSRSRSPRSPLVNY